MDVAAAYALTRAQLIEQAASIDASSARAPVSATPGWSVKDLYAHLVGVASDVLGGVMDGAGSPPWTARQVGDRAERSLEEVCAEWAAHAAKFDGWLAGVGPSGIFTAFDSWTHQQDIQGALGLSGIRDDRLDLLVASAVDAFDGRLREAGAPAIRIHGECIDRVIGDGDATASLRSGDYEIMRLLFGRRSQRQIDGWYWDGDWRACLDHLHLFDLPEVDLSD